MWNVLGCQNSRMLEKCPEGCTSFNQHIVVRTTGHRGSGQRVFTCRHALRRTKTSVEFVIVVVRGGLSGPPSPPTSGPWRVIHCLLFLLFAYNEEQDSCADCCE